MSSSNGKSSAYSSFSKPENDEDTLYATWKTNGEEYAKTGYSGGGKDWDSFGGKAYERPEGKGYEQTVERKKSYERVKK